MVCRTKNDVRPPHSCSSKGRETLRQDDGAAEASAETGAGLFDEAQYLLAKRGGETGTHAQTSLVQPPVCALG